MHVHIGIFFDSCAALFPSFCMAVYTEATQVHAGYSYLTCDATSFSLSLLSLLVIMNLVITILQSIDSSGKCKKSTCINQYYKPPKMHSICSEFAAKLKICGLDGSLPVWALLQCLFLFSFLLTSLCVTIVGWIVMGLGG